MFSFLISLASLVMLAFMMIFPQSTIGYSREALRLCYEVIIPSLFPFFVCSGLLIYSGFAKSLSRFFRPFMKPLFNVNENGASAFVLGILSGYPIGAVTACQLYEAGYLSKSETERLLAFCSNSGPLFILGAVGSAIYKSTKIGLILYSAHILSAISVGLVFRFCNKNKYNAPQATVMTEKRSVSQIFSTVLNNSVGSILTVCGSVIFFFVVTNLMLNIFPLSDTAKSIIASVFEFTGGIKKISMLGFLLDTRLVMSSAAVGFAGFSVHAQVMAQTSKYDLSLKPYIFGKLLQACFSAVYTEALLVCFPQSEGVFKSAVSPLSKGFFVSSQYVLFAVCFVFIPGLLYGILTLQKSAKKG